MGIIPYQNPGGEPGCTDSKLVKGLNGFWQYKYNFFKNIYIFIKQIFFHICLFNIKLSCMTLVRPVTATSPIYIFLMRWAVSTFK